MKNHPRPVYIPPEPELMKELRGRQEQQMLSLSHSNRTIIWAYVDQLVRCAEAAGARRPHQCFFPGNIKTSAPLAIEECVERDDGTFWVGNGEYANQVLFCPFCGSKAPTTP